MAALAGLAALCGDVRLGVCRGRSLEWWVGLRMREWDEGALGVPKEEGLGVLELLGEAG
jgi:hypothetical protein